jgi:hypothetical protein
MNTEKVRKKQTTRDTETKEQRNNKYNVRDRERKYK